MGKIKHPHKDPLGTGLLAYMEGKKRGAVIRVTSDVAVNDIIPIDYLFRDYDEMPLWEQEALKRCKGPVLDIGAGAGSHSLALLQQGLEVVAMDVSPGAVAVMKQRGLPKVLHEDIFAFSEEKFDTLLLMMNGIGLVGDLHGLNEFLVHAKYLLNPRGQILLDSSDLSYLYEETSIILPRDRYKGIIQYQMSYDEVVGDPFYWLYLDYAKLKKHAAYHGYSSMLLKEGDHFEYLARLSPLP